MPRSPFTGEVITLPQRKPAEAPAEKLVRDLAACQAALAQCERERNDALQQVARDAERIASLEARISEERSARQSIEKSLGAIQTKLAEPKPADHSMEHMAAVETANALVRTEAEARARAEAERDQAQRERDAALDAKRRILSEPIVLTFDVEYGYDGKVKSVVAREA